MYLYFDQNKLNLGTTTQHCGHDVYSQATYCDAKGELKHVVYKKNKKSSAELSKFELAFGEIANLFLSPNLTPSQNVVKNDQGDITGIASEYISYLIARREKQANVFYTPDTQNSDLIFNKINPTSVEKIPFSFLHQLPINYITALKKAESEGRISLDLSSLADVLTSSYTLEEDDLHKGNIGFYMIEKNQKPHVVFFKIDHDLMLADSVMSHCQSRFLNWFNGTDAFAITARDLLNFPKLSDSKNYYWPTIYRYFTGNKQVSFSESECKTFASLADSVEFQQLKWEKFYRHTLIPAELIKASLSNQLDFNHPEERAKISLITQSIVARQAKLRAVLFSLPEFREFVINLSPDNKTRIIKNILDAAPDYLKSSIQSHIEHHIQNHLQLCSSQQGFVVGDTPIHAAIRLGEYRFYETCEIFGYCAPQGGIIFSESDLEKINATNGLEDQVYNTKINQINSYQDLKILLRDIGEDWRFGLKMRKEMALWYLQKFIQNNQNNAQLKNILLQIKADLNGTKTCLPAPELQYIRQLRSQLWIVRLLRGLFGYTTTQGKLNRLLDNALSALEPRESCFSCFFRDKKSLFNHEVMTVDLVINPSKN